MKREVSEPEGDLDADPGYGGVDGEGEKEENRDEETVGDGEGGEEESSSPPKALRSSQQEVERDEGEREGWIQHRARVLPPNIPTLLLVRTSESKLRAGSKSTFSRTKTSTRHENNRGVNGGQSGGPSFWSW